MSVKVYADSRNRVSGTTEDFVFQIPGSVSLPESLCYIDVALVPNVFYSCVAGVNDLLRFAESTVSGNVTATVSKQVAIAPGQYNGFTLAEQVQIAMRSVSAIPSHLTVTYDIAAAKLKIDCSDPGGGGVIVFPDGLIHNGVGGWGSYQSVYPLNTDDTQSAGKLCGFVGDSILQATQGSPALGDSVIDVQRHHVLYIHSDLVAPGSTFGPRGESDIMRRVVIDAPQNGLAIDRFGTSHDSVEVNPRSLKAMRFTLRGSDGKIVDLRGHHYSFSWVFHEKM